jgi:hypothetical protein
MSDPHRRAEQPLLPEKTTGRNDMTPFHHPHTYTDERPTSTSQVSGQSEQDLPGPSRRRSSTGRWTVIEAVLGRGTLLVGPSPRDPIGEVLVLAPPGVRIPASPDRTMPVSTDGWRVALWAADEHGNRHIDVGRPIWDSPVSLAYVIVLVEEQCPQNLSWVADRLERRLRNSCLAQRPGATGHVVAVSQRWHREAEGILQEIDIALKSEPDHTWLPTDWPVSISVHGPHHPHIYEPRLKPGSLRALYTRLLDEASGSTIHHLR